MRRGTLSLCARVVQRACGKLLSDPAEEAALHAGLACDSGDYPTFHRPRHKMFKIASQLLCAEGSLVTARRRTRGPSPPARAGVPGEAHTASLDTMLRSPNLSAPRHCGEVQCGCPCRPGQILTVDDTPERPMLQLLILHLVVAVIAPACVALWGRRVFFALALVPGAAAVWAATQTSAVLSGTGPSVPVAWVPSLRMSLDFRLDTQIGRASCREREGHVAQGPHEQ